VFAGSGASCGKSCLPACQQLVVDVVAEEEILESGGYETEVTV
jgi:hypothetical protein